jgi:hypothetical protein
MIKKDIFDKHFLKRVYSLFYWLIVYFSNSISSSLWPNNLYLIIFSYNFTPGILLEKKLNIN